MVELDSAALLPDLIVAQAIRTPDAVAVRQWSTELTYRELAGRAAALAGELRALAVGPEDRIGVCLRRTPESVVAVLSVLLAGAAYVPLDPAHPRRRLLDMLDDAGVTVVLADRAGREHLGDGVRYVDVPERSAHLDLEQVRRSPAHPDNVAHVIYTSGSTGKPKGVLTTYRGITAFVAACGSWAGGVGPEMRSLGISSLGFDGATFDLYVPLSCGGSVALIGDDDRADPVRLQRFVAEHHVTWGFITPAVLSLLDPPELPDFRTLIVGGEVVAPQLVEAWTSLPGRRFRHVYGVTEGTVCQTSIELSGRWTTPLPVGPVLPGQRMYVLGDDGEQVEAGEVGEVCLGGIGTALGYLGRPGLTATRFVPDPYATEPGARMYRTGDLVRPLGDGEFAYVGRQDGQVQIRGQRVELGEIEAVLAKHPAVHDVAVIPRQAAELGGVELVAFVAPEDAPDRTELRRYAGERLTGAMVPRFVEHLPMLPLTQGGKVDRGRLRELAGQLQTVDSPSHEGVTAIWHRVLGGQPEDTDDFFTAGGHSIAAMRLVAEIRKELGRDVGVTDVYTARTLAALTERVAAAPAVTGPELLAGRSPTLAPSQRRLWFLDQLALCGATGTTGSAANVAYNVAFAERLRGRLDVDALRRALTGLAGRQAVLRWRIPHAGGRPYAVCDPPAEIALPVVDLAESELTGTLADAVRRPFDLAGGPLWHATLFRLGPADHVLLLTFHHAIVDGWSQAPLYAELSALYSGAAPSALLFGYADYADWRQRRDEASGTTDSEWWARLLRDAPTVLDLPRDRARPPVQTYAGASVTATLPANVGEGVDALAGKVGGTPAVVVLAALAEALHRLTGQPELVVGAIAADRNVAGLEDLVGFFVDILPIRLRAGGDGSFGTAVRACLEAYLAATAHPAAPLERIVGALRLPRDPGRSALVQVAFNVFNFAEPRLELPGIDAERVPVPVPGSPFDLTVYLVRRDGSYAVDLVYNPDLYDDVRMDRLAADFVALLTDLVAGPDKPVSQSGVRFRTDGVPPVDRNGVPGTSPAVPDLSGGPSGGPSGGTAPATPTERAVAGVWRSVLGLDAGQPVNATDNFFDVGGHSLALAEVRSRLAELAGFEPQIVDLFRFPSVRALAAYLDGSAHQPELERAAKVAAARRQRTRRRR